VTLAEHYGIPRDQEVADHQWMLEAAQHAGQFLAVIPSTVDTDVLPNVQC
jgi:hypothetical protein